MTSSDQNSSNEKIVSLNASDPVEMLLLGAIHLYRKKNQNYGEAWRSQGWVGNVARVLSKSARLKNMLWREDPINDEEETVQETLLDLINLAAFAIINMRDRNKWGK